MLRARDNRFCGRQLAVDLNAEINVSADGFAILPARGR